MFAAALLLAGIAILLRVTQPTAYRLERGGLVITRRRGERRLSGRVEPHLELRGCAGSPGAAAWAGGAGDEARLFLED